MPGQSATPPTFTAVDIKRFWSNVLVRGAEECWPWTRGKDDRGYGKFWACRRDYGAHRVARFLSTGEWPGKLFTCHDCPGGDNPLCCNPAHLWLGTNAQNTADRHRKGRDARGDRHGSQTHPERVPRGDSHPNRLHPERRPRGEDHGCSRLNESDVREIRFLYATGKCSQVFLAGRYGVSQSNISLIVRGVKWAHVR